MLKLGFLALFILSIFTVQAGPTSVCDDEDDVTKVSNAVCMFSQPLLVGASITRGQGANAGGPAQLIAESLSPGAEITNISMSGTKSVDSLKDHEMPKDRPSIVIGLDLFFWDAVKQDCGQDFEKSTKKFLKLYQHKKIPMILAKLPKNVTYPSGYRLLNSSSCTDKINQLIEEECTLEKNCLIYDPNDCFSKMDPQDRTTYFVDRLHTSVAGNQFCAQEFIGSQKYNKLKCKNR